jgi:hypothetical protein
MLMDELHGEVTMQRTSLERLQAENEQYERLAAVNREAAAAVAEHLRALIGIEHAMCIRVNRRDQLWYFLAGVAASIPIQLLVNWMT